MYLKARITQNEYSMMMIMMKIMISKKDDEDNVYVEGGIMS